MATKKEMDDLKRRFISAETEEERNEIGKEISAAIEQNAEEVAAITLSQLKETNERAQDELVRNRLKSVLPAISLSYIAKTYFNKSRSWLNQRINGNTVNGVQAKFSQEELRTLDFALKDLSAKLAEIRVHSLCFIDNLAEAKRDAPAKRSGRFLYIFSREKLTLADIIFYIFSGYFVNICPRPVSSQRGETP